MNDKGILSGMTLDLMARYQVCRECGRAYRDGEPGAAPDDNLCGKCFPWQQEEERREVADG